MERKEVEAMLAAAETRRRQAVVRAEENAARLADLETEHAALLGEAKIAERGIADFDAHLEHLRSQLAEVELAEARNAVQEAADVRDAALAAAVEVAGHLMVAIERIAAARSTVEETHRRLLAVDGQACRAAPAEPLIMDEQWKALGPIVAAELGVQLDSELVDAAVRSPNSLVLESLPEHLRELARNRKRDLHRGAFQRRDETA